VFGRASRGPERVGARPAGASAEGVLDLAGNVWEWCLDRYEPDGYARLDEDAESDPDEDPLLDVTGPGARAVKRGGSWTNAASSLRCAKRACEKLHVRRNNLGFRCVVPVEVGP